MAKSPLILAALAKSAVPELQIARVSRLHGSQTGHFDSALISTHDGGHFVVRIPQNPNSALELDVEVTVLKALTPGLRAKLPFKVTNLVGHTADENKNRVAIFEYLFGTPANLRKLSPTSTLTQSIAESIAAIHSIDARMVSSAGLPEFDSATVLRRRMNDLDAIAMTGRVSKTLLDRWQEALEDVSLFRFQPRVVHGELNEDTVLTQDNRVSAILNWGALHIGDPAEDLFWLCGNYDSELMDAVRMIYSQAKGAADSSIIERAQLYFEMECGRWLLHCIKSGSAELIDDAESLLAELARRLENGELPALRATPVTSVPASQDSFISTTQIQVTEEDVSTSPIVTTAEVNEGSAPESDRRDLF